MISDSRLGYPVVVEHADDIELSPIDVLRREFEELTGEAPDGRIGRKRLERAIADLKDGE